jgi:acyl carrier protein
VNLGVRTVGHMSFDEFCNHVAAVAMVDRSQLSAATRLDAGLLDSIAVLEVLVAMEDSVGRDVPWELFSTVETLGEARGWIVTAGAGRPPTSTVVRREPSRARRTRRSPPSMPVTGTRRSGPYAAEARRRGR